MNVRSFYETHGYHIHDLPLISADKVAAARAGMESVRAGDYDTGKSPGASGWNPGDDLNTLCKIELPQLANRAIADLIRSPELGAHIAAATGAEMVQVWWVQFLYKPPVLEGIDAPTKVGWHQDWTYWKDDWEASSEVLTAWVAVSDVGENSGPMCFVPGSHVWQGVGGGDFFSQAIDRNAFALPTGAVWHETPALMQAGGCSLHNSLVIHGSGPNTSAAPRCAFAVHVRTEKSRAWGGARRGNAAYIDDLEVCPIIYGSRQACAFA